LLPPLPTWSDQINEIEELADLRVHRPLARRLVGVLMSSRVTPDQVTVTSGVLGVLAGVVLWFAADSPALRLLSAVLLFGSVVLDCADGQLARARHQASANGAILDGLADMSVGIAVISGAAHVAARYDQLPFVSALGPVAILSTFVQCFCFDIAKERYLAARNVRCVGSKRVLADEEMVEGSDRRPASTRRGILHWMFRAYALVLTALSDTHGTARESAAADASRIRTWAFLGQGTHMALLYASAALSCFWPSALHVCLLVFAGVMNAALVALLLTERRRPVTTSSCP
jgi:phosphatidylglycerophosphate synthase